MKKKLLGALPTLAAYIVLGACVMVGIRSMEWLIPRPDTRILLCLADGEKIFGACKTLKELVADDADGGK